MAKKPIKDDETEITIETDVEDETKLEITEPKKPVNIMDPKDSSEPPKRKAKDDAPSIDLSPVIDEVKKGFASLAPKETPKPEPKSEEKGFMDILGEW